MTEEKKKNRMEENIKRERVTSSWHEAREREKKRE